MEDLTQYYCNFPGEAGNLEIGEIRGGAGDDIIIVGRPALLSVGDKIGDAPLDGPDTRPVAGQELRLQIDGGAGNDWLITGVGEGAVTIGGAGSDRIFNRTTGGVIYGDAIDGDNDSGSGDSDNFWWWQDTTIKDAKDNDVLSFFGFPLTGGNQNLPLTAAGAAGGGAFAFLAQPAAGIAFAGAARETGVKMFFDNYMVFMTYIFTRDEQGNLNLHVINMVDALVGLFGDYEFDTTGENRISYMTVENFDPFFSNSGFDLLARSRADERGTLGMVFKLVNLKLAIMALLPPVGGGFNKVLPFLDEVAALAATLPSLVKGIGWSTGTDPLILDLDGDGIETVSIGDGDVYFDVDGDFFAERTGWLSGDDGFLALDKNRNGAY